MAPSSSGPVQFAHSAQGSSRRRALQGAASQGSALFSNALFSNALPSDALLEEALLAAFAQRFQFRKGRFVPLAPGRGEDRGSLTTGENLNREKWQAIAREITVLHEAYIQGGRRFPQGKNPLLRHQAGYQFYFLPRNLLRVRQVLEALPWLPRTGLAALAGGGEGEAPTLRMLDLGCGSGALSLALLGQLAAERARHNAAGLAGAPPALHLVLVDQSRSLLALAEANIHAYVLRALPGLRFSLELRAEGVDAYLATERRGGAFGVVGAGMMLNELLVARRGAKRALRLTAPLGRLLMPGGMLLLVEPGTRKGYMNLLTVREQLSGQGILYPCPHNDACPLWNARVSRWCHATRPFPPHWLFADALRYQGGLEFGLRELHFAGLAVQGTKKTTTKAALQQEVPAPHGSRGIGFPFHARRGERIVSAPLPDRQNKGKAKKPASVLLSCGPDGLRERPLSALEGYRGYGPYTRGRWLG